MAGVQQVPLNYQERKPALHKFGILHVKLLRMIYV